MSSNKSSVTITRLSVPSFVPTKRTYANQWAPRLAVSKKIMKHFWLYASAAKGFSPPTVAELLPGTININTSLQPEEGNNYEAGIKTSQWNDRLYIELTHFSYRLKNAIVVRKDPVNGDDYVNAGSTKQNGTEFQAAYRFLQKNNSWLSQGNLEISYTNYNFHYQQFKHGTADYSGKKLPSVAPNAFSATLDLSSKTGLFLNLGYYYSDAILLNDANTASASSYQLVSAKLGWKTEKIRHFLLQVFAGGENLLNERYSLGNDINAAGDRFYNCAPGRNYYAGIKLQWNKEKQ
jgi:iron complex outermembrane receptor protein